MQEPQYCHQFVVVDPCVRVERHTQCACSFQWMYRPTANSPKNAPANTEQKYPTFSVMTANILDWNNLAFHPQFIKPNHPKRTVDRTLPQCTETAPPAARPR